MLQLADYNETGDILCQHPGWTSKTTNIPLVPREEDLYRNKATESREKRAMWKPEQKNVSWMKDLDGKLTRGRDLVMDFCEDTCPTRLACMLLNQFKKFSGCDLDSKVLSATEPDLVLTLASQRLCFRK